MEVNQTKSFEAAASKQLVWLLINDPWKVGACISGAKIIEELENDQFKGELKMKIGPVTTHFEGNVEILSRNEADHIITLQGQGSDKKGKGEAKMQLVIELKEAAENLCQIEARMQLSISGRIAQFGSRMIQAVNDKLFTQFTKNFLALIEKENQEFSETGKLSDGSKSSDGSLLDEQNGEVLNMNQVVMSIAAESVIGKKLSAVKNMMKKDES